MARADLNIQVQVVSPKVKEECLDPSGHRFESTLLAYGDRIVSWVNVVNNAYFCTRCGLTLEIKVNASGS